MLKKTASRYKGSGANYPGRYQNDSAQRSAAGAGQDDSRNKSRWSNWLERVNDT